MKRIRKISDKRYLIIIITFILSVMYIIGISYYDKKPNEINKLYRGVNIRDIKYEQIEVDIIGFTDGEKISKTQALEMENECNKAFSHTKECSKLCVLNHSLVGKVEVFSENKLLNIVGNSCLQKTNYTFTIKNKEQYPNSINYNISIKGLEDIETIDYMRDRAIQLFKTWRIKTKETISIVGYIKGKPSEIQKENYKAQIFKSLNGHFIEYYQDDYNHSTESYYGYTPLVNTYLKLNENKKVNTQIIFTYNEINDSTKVIVAFPFYNNPY